MFRFPARVADLTFSGASRQILQTIQHLSYSIIIDLQASDCKKNTLIFIEFRVYEYVELYLHISQWRTQEFCLGGGGSTNLVEDRGQRERGSVAVVHLSGVLEAAVIWYKKFHFI